MVRTFGIESKKQGLEELVHAGESKALACAKLPLTLSTAPAKLLMLGEHTVLHGSSAFAVPLRQFSARLSTSPQPPSALPAGLDMQAWSAFAKTQALLRHHLHLDQWEQEANVLQVVSNIPSGYGLGSSGALTALVFERFRKTDLAAPLLRQVLATLENFFHGTSSGLDPLVSYHDAAIKIDCSGAVTLLPKNTEVFPHFTSQDGWFLLDSQLPRLGEAAITRFGESCKDSSWRKQALHPMQTLVNELVPVFAQQVNMSGNEVQNKLHQLSSLQLQYLNFLIPPAVAKTWQTLLNQNLATMKLCGAGGGGYFLGYTPNKHLLQQKHDKLLWLHK